LSLIRIKIGELGHGGVLRLANCRSRLYRCGASPTHPADRHDAPIAGMALSRDERNRAQQ